MTAKYDINDLSTVEIKQLISKLKHPTNVISFNDMFQKISNSFSKKTNDILTLDEFVLDVGDDILYILHFRRSRFEDRYTIHLRFKENSFHLIRIDIGSGHRNPDNTKLNEDHIHFYVDSNNPSTDWAMPLSSGNFPNVQNFVDAFKTFLIYTNIKS
ncbi:MAG: hypothetical protein ABF975_01185 [Liquorilactobacillus hordei]|uniref:DUF6978 family protein n=1 Tax=Liquorilactobacillus hordei TaxID=468911 RepID=UPI0039EA4338